MNIEKYITSRNLVTDSHIVIIKIVRKEDTT